MVLEIQISTNQIEIVGATDLIHSFKISLSDAISSFRKLTVVITLVLAFSDILYFNSFCELFMFH